MDDYHLELSSLARIDLSTQWIQRFDDEEEKKEFYSKLRQIKELNLRQNLFKSASELWRIIDEYFHQLEILNLSNSRLLFDRIPSGEYRQMKELVLIDLQLDLPQFANVFRSFPNLENLHLDKNCLTTVSEEFVQQIRHLTRLSLSDNPQLKEWHPSINRLGHLEHLEELFLNNCGIKEIRLDAPFPRLKSLYLSDNSIADFQSIEELSKLKYLESLSLLRNPLYPSNENQSETTKQLIIARLPNLLSFNRVAIPRDERRGAEIDYLSFYSKEYFLNAPDFHFQHPQYKRLIDKHGEPNQPTIKQVRSIENERLDFSSFRF